MKIITTSLLGLFFASSLWAHAGHDHASLQAPHGGAVYEGKKLGIELVQEGPTVKLYPVGADWKALPLTGVEMTAQMELPKKKPEALALKKETDHFSAQVEAKGSYRYKMTVNLSAKGEKEAISFQVEPQ